MVTNPETAASGATQLSRADVVELVRQAVLAPSDADIDAYTDQLNTILATVSKVTELRDRDIKPTSHVTDMTNAFRDDEIRPSLTVSQALAMAPAAEADRFQVPQILGEEQ